MTSHKNWQYMQVKFPENENVQITSYFSFSGVVIPQKHRTRKTEQKSRNVVVLFLHNIKNSDKINLAPGTTVTI